MSKKKAKREQDKEPIDMTTDEAIDYVFAPEIADELRKLAKDNDAETTDSEEDCR